MKMYFTKERREAPLKFKIYWTFTFTSETRSLLKHSLNNLHWNRIIKHSFNIKDLWNFHLFSIIPDIPETGAPGSDKLCQAGSNYSGANQTHPACSTNQSNKKNQSINKSLTIMSCSVL